MTTAKQACSVGRAPDAADAAALCEIVSRHIRAPLEASQVGEVFGATSGGLHLLITSRAERVYACIAQPGRESVASLGRWLAGLGLGGLAAALALSYFDERQAGAIAGCLALALLAGAWLARHTLREAQRATDAILREVGELLRR